MAIDFPRIPDSCFSLRPSSSWSWKRMDPETLAFLGRRPMAASAVPDLPEPASPTMPSTSSGAMEKEMPRTAWTTLPALEKSTWRSSTLMVESVTSGPDPVLLGVEGPLQPIPDEEHRQNENQQE